MSTAIETLPSRHKVSWKGWMVALLAAAIVAGAFGTYLALRGPAASSPSIVQTVNPPSRVTPVENLQPGAVPRGQGIMEERNVGGIDGTIIQPATGLEDQGKIDTGSSSTNAPGSPNPNCLSTVSTGPC
jgi:hypothetical protein